MRLSRRTEYGLRAMVQLAKTWPAGMSSVPDLSQSEGMPTKYVETILQALRRAGFLESKTGAGGGYRLSRSPREINIGEVIHRLEYRFTEEIDQENRADEHSAGGVAIRILNESVTNAIDKTLGGMNLEQLLEQVTRAASRQEMYYI